MRNRFGMLYSSDIRSSITEITSEASKLKKEIFKSVMMNKELDPAVAKVYMGAVNDFLRFWEEYAKDMEPKMKRAKGVTGIHTVEYSFIKDYIYAKYDYASVLPFADGLVRGMQDEKFTRVEDIGDFRDQTLKKAFDDMPVNSAGVLDVVINPALGVDFNTAVSPMDAKMYDSVKSYHMFDPRSRTELYRAIDKTIDFITIDLEHRHYPQHRDMKLFVSMINNIVEYITYSLTAYACRIYIIGQYAYPFIYADESSSGNVISESADNDDKKDKKDGNVPSKGEGEHRPEIEVTIMRDADDTMTRDPQDIGKFFTTFEQFIKIIGAESLFNGSTIPKYPNGYIGQNTLEANRFSQKLMANPLFEMFRKYIRIFADDQSQGRVIEEFNQNLKSFTHNSVQAVQGTSTPKQEILHVIRGVECGNTAANYQELAKDLYVFSLFLLCEIFSKIGDMSRLTSSTIGTTPQSINTRNAGIEALSVLSELYRDIAVAVMYKARDIEAKLNETRNATIANVHDSLTIKIPDVGKSKDRTSHMSSAVPDTTRLPMDLLDLYEIPVFESLELYDECLRLDPAFANDYYFTEGAIANIINALRSKIIAAWNKIKNFFQDRKFKEAIAWVQKHKSELMAMNLAGITMSVIDYKVDIALPEGFENLIKNLQNIPEKALESQEEMEKWAATLYPNPTIHGWFSGDGDNKKDGARMWRNLFLFQDLNEVDDKPHETPIQINDAQVAKNLPKWIETIETADSLYKQLEKMETEIENASNKLRARTVAAANKQGGDNAAATGGATTGAAGGDDKKVVTANANGGGSGTGGGTGGTTGGSGSGTPAPTPAAGADTKKEEQSMQGGSSVLSAAITQADVAITRLYLSLGPMVVEYMRKEYEYLQTAYSYSKKKNASDRANA